MFAAAHLLPAGGVLLSVASGRRSERDTAADTRDAADECIVSQVGKMQERGQERERALREFQERIGQCEKSASGSVVAQDRPGASRGDIAHTTKNGSRRLFLMLLLNDDHVFTCYMLADTQDAYALVVVVDGS
jgi:hypothetical protein